MSAVAKKAATPLDQGRPQGAQAIQRALRVLECFSVDHPTVSLTEITNATGLTMPTAHRIVKALQGNRFLTHDDITSKYSLGPALLRLAEIILRRDENVAAVATPYLERLRDISTESVGLHTRMGDERMCVVEIVGHHQMRMATGIGHVYPLHAGAAGKAILAWLPADQVDELLSKPISLVSTGQARSAAQLRKELAAIRNQGYATSDGETVPQASALAAPVFSSTGVIGSINITGPDTRWTSARMTECAPELLKVTKTLSRQFGHHL